MLSKGHGKTMGSYFMLLDALAEEGRIEEAEELWMKIFMKNPESVPRVFFTHMIAMYDKNNMTEKLFEIFADMEELGVNPDYSTVVRVARNFKKMGMLDKYEKVHKKYPPPQWEYRYYKGKRVKRRVQITSDYGKDIFPLDGNSSNTSVEEQPTVEALPVTEDERQQDEVIQSQQDMDHITVSHLNKDCK
eukprot:Gb_34727 [translate_table: standard]